MKKFVLHYEDVHTLEKNNTVVYDDSTRLATINFEKKNLNKIVLYVHPCKQIGK